MHKGLTMKTLKILSIMIVFSLSLWLSAVAPAQETATEVKKSLVGNSADMTEGEIRKIDINNKKITIKHGEIKNLEMPGMTMVFQVKDPVMLDKVKAGDKVKFRAEKTGSAFVVTDIVPSK